MSDSEPTNRPDARHRDGNALAGELTEILGFDPTATVLTCAACGRAAVFAEQPMYSGPGDVLRCGGCAAVVARVVRTPTDVWLDLRGARSWRIPLGS